VNDTKKLKINPLKTVRNDAGLWELIDGATEKPLLLILTSEEYCQPCQLLHPCLRPLADEYSDKLTIAKVDPGKIEDESMDELDVDGVPTLLFVFKDEILDQYDGFDGDMDDVHAFLDHNIGEWEKECTKK